MKTIGKKHNPFTFSCSTITLARFIYIPIISPLGLKASKTERALCLNHLSLHLAEWRLNLETSPGAALRRTSLLDWSMSAACCHSSQTAATQGNAEGLQNM